MVPVDRAVTLVVGIDSPGGPFLRTFSLIINGVTKLVFSLATIFPNEYKGHLLFCPPSTKAEVPMARLDGCFERNDKKACISLTVNHGAVQIKTSNLLCMMRSFPGEVI